MDRNLSFNDINVKLLLDLIFQVQESLSADTIHNTAVVWWGDHFEVSVSTHPKGKHIQDSHFLDVIV